MEEMRKEERRKEEQTKDGRKKGRKDSNHGFLCRITCFH
jgi:hypothetical protein